MKVLNMERIVGIISEITGYEEEDFTINDTLINNLGFDSIMIMDLHAIITKECNSELKLDSTFIKEIMNKDITISELADLLKVETQRDSYPKENIDIDCFTEVVEFADYFESVGGNILYFKENDGIARNIITIEGAEKINFATYNYVGLNGCEEVREYTVAAIERYGTSVSGSRLLSGQIALHEKLERQIADFIGIEDALVQVGGHSTNVNTIGNIVDQQDLILHDSLAHNSIVQGAILSHAKRKSFKHNDMSHLESELTKLRNKFRRVLIIAEGVYSMDGDICNLPELIRLKNQYGCILMIDEAHSFGTIGKNGRGVTSYYGIDPNQVDILMGTLSKSAASCGGYIAGSKMFIRHLRFNSPGFIFSCGLTPANTAAAYKAIELFDQREENFKSLKENASYFLEQVKSIGYDTGKSCDTPIIPIILGDSKKAMAMAASLFDKGVNVFPIIYPAVNENEARLRFFISSTHTKQNIDNTISILEELKENTLRGITS